MHRARYELEVETEFCAAHAIMIAGRREPVHGHSWRVRVVLAGDELDADGLLCDFHAVEHMLAEIIAPMHNNDLNTTDSLNGINPTAEHVARHIGESLAQRIERAFAERVRVASVRITEAPGCAARWINTAPAERHAAST